MLVEDELTKRTDYAIMFSSKKYYQIKDAEEIYIKMRVGMNRSNNLV